MLTFCGSRAIQAKANKTVDYVYESVWASAIRFLRVDQNFPILERDREGGFILFEAKDDGKFFRGSLELIRQATKTGEEVLVVLRITDRPTYVERVLMNRLLARFRADKLPQAPRRVPAPEPAGDEAPESAGEASDPAD